MQNARVLLVIDLVGVFVFALAGATAAVRQRLDLFGVLVLSFATASAGGILRDLLIGAVPPAAFRDWRYLAAAMLAGLVTFIWHGAIERMRNPVRVFDAAGLGLFAVAGTQKALAVGLHPVMAALLGMLTGIGGGIVRDLLLSRVPVVFQSDIYALAALAGAAVVVIGHWLPVARRCPRPSPARCCASVCASSRCGSTGICRARIATTLDRLRRVSTTPRIALVAGASGLVGGFLLKALLDAPDYSRVFALTRRPLGREHPKLANRIVAFRAHGGTAQGPGRERRVLRHRHHDRRGRVAGGISRGGRRTPCCCSRAPRARPAPRASSSCPRSGADSGSKKFYLRTKGEMEEAVADVGFASVDILQPSLLLGPRKALRPLEITGRIFAPLINPLLTGNARSLPRDSGRNRRPRDAGRGARRATWRLPLHLRGYPASSRSCARRSQSRRRPPKRRPPEHGAPATVTRRAFAARLHSVKSAR